MEEHEEIRKRLEKDGESCKKLEKTGKRRGRRKLKQVCEEAR